MNLLKDQVTFTVISLERNDKWPLTAGILEEVILTTNFVELDPF